MQKFNATLTNTSVKREHRHFQYRCSSRVFLLRDGCLLLTALFGTCTTGGFLLYGMILASKAGNAWSVSDEAALFTIFLFMAMFLLMYLCKVGAVVFQPPGTRLYFRKSMEEIEKDLKYMDTPGALGQLPLSEQLPIPALLRVGKEFIYIKGPAAALIPVNDLLWIYCCQTPKKTFVKKQKDAQPLIYQVHFMTTRGSHYYVDFDTWEEMAAFMRPLELAYPDLCHEYDGNRYMRWWFHFDDFKREMNDLREFSAHNRTHLYPALERTLETACAAFPKVRAKRLYRYGDADSLPYALVVTDMESEGADRRRIRGYASGKIRKGELLVVYDNIREAGTCIVEEVLEDPEYRGSLIVKDFHAEIRTPEAVVLTTQSEQDSVLPMNPAVFALVATAGQWPEEGRVLSYLSFAVQTTEFLAPIYRENGPDTSKENPGEHRRFTLMSVARHSEDSEQFRAEDPQPMMVLLTDLRDSGRPKMDPNFDIRFARMEFPEILSYVKSSFYGLAVNPFGPATANLPNDFLHNLTTSNGYKRLEERKKFLNALLSAHGDEWYFGSLKGAGSEEHAEHIPTVSDDSEEPAASEDDIPTYSEEN